MNAQRADTELHSISRRSMLGFAAAAAALPIAMRIGAAQAASKTARSTRWHGVSFDLFMGDLNSMYMISVWGINYVKILKVLMI